MLKSVIKRCLHEWKYRELTTRSKALVTLKNWKVRLNITKNKKEPAQL